MRSKVETKRGYHQQLEDYNKMEVNKLKDENINMKQLRRGAEALWKTPFPILNPRTVSSL